jgi:hypothetical protein
MSIPARGSSSLGLAGRLRVLEPPFGAFHTVPSMPGGLAIPIARSISRDRCRSGQARILRWRVRRPRRPSGPGEDRRIAERLPV